MEHSVKEIFICIDEVCQNTKNKFYYQWECIKNIQTILM